MCDSLYSLCSTESHWDDSSRLEPQTAGCVHALLSCSPKLTQVNHVMIVHTFSFPVCPCSIYQTFLFTSTVPVRGRVCMCVHGGSTSAWRLVLFSRFTGHGEDRPHVSCAESLLPSSLRGICITLNNILMLASWQILFTEYLESNSRTDHVTLKVCVHLIKPHSQMINLMKTGK